MASKSSDALSAAAIAMPGLQVVVLERCASTNAVLLDDAAGIERARLVAAEVQSAGRGRRGRRWHSVPGASATFSLARVVRRPARELAGLSLVAGVAAAQALHALGVHEARLKWPNDLVVGEAKLGGILVETRAAASGTLAVIGIGLNCRQSAALEERVQRRLASVDRFATLASRNVLIRTIAQRLLEALDRFEAHGLEPTRRAWQALDALAGKPLRVRVAGGRVLSGVASGLAEDGGLRLLTARGMQTVHSGTVLAARRVAGERGLL